MRTLQHRNFVLAEFFYRRSNWLCIIFFLSTTMGFGEISVFAGGGPENVFVVVNQRSWSSRTIANYFCALRKIPSSNVMYVDWKERVDRTNVNKFRERLLGPVWERMQKQGLSGQIDYIVYSSDFPFAINLKPDQSSAEHPTMGSITGLTYLAPLVMAKRPEYRGLNVNWYMRPWLMLSSDRLVSVPMSRGFRTSFGWASSGNVVADGGQHYVLSTMLAYTSGRGNSVSGAIQYLRSSARADGTFPKGTIYFARNNDVRSQVRDYAFQPVVDELSHLGVLAEIVEGIVPQAKQDVQGATTGAPIVAWETAGNWILPGAICDNLTSFGGNLSEDSSQTPLTAPLGIGATGSSGTVAEPRLRLAKFPHPMIHVHYARGCTLAEAFYQSVYGPFQLLIVGDPLCRPWARIPPVSMDGLKPNQTVKGSIKLTPKSTDVDADGIGHYQIYIDGKMVALVEPQKSWEFDSRRFMDGYHELRLVAFENSSIQTQGRHIVRFHINNRGQRVEGSVTPEKSVGWNERLHVTAHSPGAAQIVVLQNRQVLAKIQGERGEVEFEASRLGMGPVTLTLAALKFDDKSSYVLSEPVRVQVKPPPPLDPVMTPTARLASGLQLSRANVNKQSIIKTIPSNWPVDVGMQPHESYVLTGYLQITHENVYQFQIAVTGNVELFVNGQRTYVKQDGPMVYDYVPVSLRPGWHEIQLRGTTGGHPHIHVAFGGPGLYAIGARQFRHVP